MAGRRKKYPLIEGLEITGVAAEGKALGKVGDMVVFVPMAVPGDVVNVQIVNKRRRYMEGYVTEYIRESPLKIKPFCAHFGHCGGCKWQHLPYEQQLAYKQQQVEDQLSRIGKIDLPAVMPIIGSKNSRFYRNKLEFTFSDRKWLPREALQTAEPLDRENALGFHVTGAFDKILDIDYCYLQPDPSNALRTHIREFCLQHGYSFYNVHTHAGFMRTIVIRTASTGEVMLIVVFGHEDEPKRKALLDGIVAQFPEITSLIYVINPKFNDTFNDLETVCYYGKDHIIEEMEGLRFRIGPKSFYQTNSEQAYELYKAVRDFAALTGAETVYDLYTGTGTIANFVASGCKKVVGVEYIPEAIEDAVINSRLNGIENTVFYAGDMKKVLTESFIAENGRPQVIILDPPRAGIDEEVAQTILKAAPERIVYVSCNPATQARDIAVFDDAYKVTKVQPVDMFPHTHHVENVVLLVKR